MNSQYNYSRQQLREAAFLAAKFVVDNLDSLPEVLTDEFLLSKGDLVPPPLDAPLSYEVFQQWSLDKCFFREEWRKRVHVTIGRYPSTVRGEGFRLLKPNENATFGENAAYDAALRGFKKGKFIIEHTRLDELGSEERSKLHNAKIRLAALESAVSSTERENKRRRRFKELREDNRPAIPSVGGHLPE